METGPNCYLAKSDLKFAFRQLPIRKEDWRWLLLKAKNPRNNKTYFFFDRCTPFGSSISCCHFQRFSNGLAWIFKYKTGRKTKNYLDDFLFAALQEMYCNYLVTRFLDLCDEINLPVPSVDKMQWATQIIVFLAMLLNTITQTCSCNWKALQQEILYQNCRKLKQHHHIRVDKEMKLDTLVWAQFLETPAAMYRPFIDFDAKTVHADEIDFHSDASGAKNLRCGAILGKAWFFTQWEPGFINTFKPSIEFLELYAVTLAIELWSYQLRNKRVIIFCDNLSVVHMLARSTSSCPRCLRLLRVIMYSSLKYNVRYFMKHVTSKNNLLADLLSQQKIEEFKKQAPKKHKCTTRTITKESMATEYINEGVYIELIDILLLPGKAKRKRNSTKQLQQLHLQEDQQFQLTTFTRCRRD